MNLIPVMQRIHIFSRSLLVNGERSGVNGLFLMEILMLEPFLFFITKLISQIMSC